MLRHRLEHRLRQLVRFEQMPEVQDRRLIRNRVPITRETTNEENKVITDASED
jgi:hypothetical protein